MDIEYEIIQLLDKYYGSQFNDISAVLRELISSNILEKYDIKIPRDLMLVIRTIVMIDDFGKELDSTFNTTEILKPYAIKLVLNNFKPENILRKGNEYYMDISYFMKELPDSLINFLKVVDDDGKVGLNIEFSELDSLNNIFTRIVNELVLSIIIAALLIGSSLIIRSNLGISIFGYSLLGFVGFVFSAVLGVILIILIIRRGNY